MIRKLQILILAFLIWILMYPNPFAQDATAVTDTTKFLISSTISGVFPFDKVSPDWDFDVGGALTADVKIGSRMTFRFDYARFEMTGEDTTADIKGDFWAAGLCYWIIPLDQSPKNNFYLIFEGSYNDIESSSEEISYFSSSPSWSLIFSKVSSEIVIDLLMFFMS